jgi:raffinose/stachyose/melibiose transport system substrate-binding protein
MQWNSVWTGALFSCALALLASTPQARAADAKTITEWDLQTGSGAKNVLDDAGARFQKTHPGTMVEQSHILNDAHKTKLSIALGAGQPPCVFAGWGAGRSRNT